MKTKVPLVEDKAVNPVWGSVLLFAFGLAVLGFVIAIDHGDWFHIRPASGTAVAMSYASDRPAIN